MAFLTDAQQIVHLRNQQEGIIMRKTLGIGVLLAGIAGLGIWGAGHQARTVEETLSLAATQTAGRATHAIEATVSGRDILLRGNADNEAEHRELIAAFDAIEGYRVIRDELDVLATITPYTFSAIREDGNTRVEGYVPHEDSRAALAQLEVAESDSLVLASGAPDTWLAAAETGITALNTLEHGKLELKGQAIALTGMTRGPDERRKTLDMLAAVPPAYRQLADIDMRDDGTPPAFQLAWDASLGARLTGKLPMQLDTSRITRALELDQIENSATLALFEHGQSDDAEGLLGGLGNWLAQIDLANLSFDDGTSALTATPTPGADLELIAAGLAKDLPDTEIDVAAHDNLPEEGARRQHAATGQEETFTDGYWLPLLDFTPYAATCASESEAALQTAKINFVSGSARLGPRAVSAINRVAAVMRRCVNEAGLTAELGGHTDNTGNQTINQTLSLERAQAVKQALRARGVPGDALTTVGYGQTRPIADNSTQTGRAANRRTTIQWFGGQ